MFWPLAVVYLISLSLTWMHRGDPFGCHPEMLHLNCSTWKELCTQVKCSSELYVPATRSIVPRDRPNTLSTSKFNSLCKASDRESSGSIPLRRHCDLVAPRRLRAVGNCFSTTSIYSICVSLWYWYSIVMCTKFYLRGTLYLSLITQSNGINLI